MVSALEELAASIARARELVACLHDLDVGEAEVRDGLEESRRRVDAYRGAGVGRRTNRADGRFTNELPAGARPRQFALSRSVTERVSRSGS